MSFCRLDRLLGCDPSGCFTFRAVEKAQVTSGLHTAVQARGVGGLHASLLSGTEDKPAAPVRKLLSTRLRSEASAGHPTIVRALGVGWVLQSNCIVPANSVISFVVSFAVRDCRVELLVVPMSA